MFPLRVITCSFERHRDPAGNCDGISQPAPTLPHRLLPELRLLGFSHLVGPAERRNHRLPARTRRVAGARRRRGDPVPRPGVVGEGRISRRRRLLRAERVPHHLAAAGRASKRPAGSISSRSGRGARGACSRRCSSCWRGRALRRGVGPADRARIASARDGFASLLYVSNWKFIFDGHVVLPGVPGTVSARAHVVARDRRTVVPALAARAAAPDAHGSGRARALVAAVDRRPRLGSAALDGDAVPSGGRSVARLLRHRHARAGAARRRRVRRAHRRARTRHSASIGCAGRGSCRPPACSAPRSSP